MGVGKVTDVLNKRLCMDILRQTKRPGIIAPTDLKSCYDRICHNVASLSMQRIGLAESEIQCMFRPLPHLEHSIRCAFGTSQETYGNELNSTPMQGVYQGNGAGPIIWAVVSSPLLQILKEDGYGTYFRTALSDKPIRIVGYAFVDDTDLIQTADSEDTYSDVHHKMQEAVDLWEGLIKNTGGALAVIKCRWWGIDFKWNHGKWSYRNKHDFQQELFAIDTSGTRQKIKQLDVSDAYETLGVFITADGNHREQLKIMKEQARDWADRLRTSFLSENEAVQALHSTILKKLEYPLLAMSLSREECDSILQPIFQAALPKARINRNFNRKVLRGPGGLMGLEMPCLYTSQVSEHIECLIRHGGSDTITGQLLDGTIEVAKAEIGIAGDLFSIPFDTHSHLVTSGWIKHVWREIQEMDIHVRERTTSLALKRLGDSFLMDTFRSKGYSEDQLELLNMVRIFVRVTTLSDMVSGDGRYLLSFVNGNPNNSTNPISHYSSVNWPTQGNPPSKAWRLWSRALKRCYPHSKDLQLEHPLGVWIWKDEKWGSFWDQHTYSLYINHDGRWYQYQKNNNIMESDRIRFHEVGHKPPPHDCSHLAVAWLANGEICFRGIGKWKGSLTEEAATWEQEWFEEPNHEQMQVIGKAISHGQAIAMTDGSFANKIGTAGFCLGTSVNCLIRGACRVPGYDKVQSSYRSELAGIYATLRLGDRVCKAVGITSGKITLACDNISAGNISLRRQFPITPKWNNFDLIASIHRLLKNVPFVVEYKHVHGHQKERNPSAPLDEWAILNDEMDSLAKAYMHRTATFDPLDQSIDGHEWAVWIRGNKIVSDLKYFVTQAIRRQSILNEWTLPRMKYGTTVSEPKFSITQLDIMDEANIRAAWQQAKGYIRRFVCKASINQLATGKYMRRMGFWPSDKCPRCLDDNETSIHVLQCPSTASRDNLRESIKSFTKQMKQLATHPAIIKAAIYLLHKGTNSSDVTFPINPTVQELVTKQLHLPIIEFLRGRIVTIWSLVQGGFYRTIQSPRSEDRWAALFVTNLWDIYFSAWTHRNDTLHQSENKKDTIYNFPELNYEIRRQWRIGTHGLHDADKKHFHITQAQLLRKNRQYKLTWLAQVEMARKAKHITKKRKASS